MATLRRQQRVSQFIRQEAASIIRDLGDPRIGFVTIIEVDVSSDLRYATIHYSVYGSDAQKRTTHRALVSARGLFRRRIGEVMRIRSVPEIRFEPVKEENEERPEVLDTLDKVQEELDSE